MADDIYTQNANARNILLANCIDAVQQIYSTTIGTPTTANATLNIPVRNVGFIKGFLVEITGTVTPGAAAVKLTPFGLGNLLANVQFTDLANNVRINTAGWHITMINTAKRQWVYGSAIATDTSLGYGSNYNVVTPATGLNGATTAQNFRMFYYIPLSYSDSDLSGGIYANVVNATMNLQLGINVNTYVAAAADPTLAVFTQSTATASSAPITNMVVTVYQNYLDQVPMGNNGPILPALDISTIYGLYNTSLSAVVQNQPFAIPYANFRDFYSTCVVFDQGVTPWLTGYLPGGGTAAVPGSDVSNWALQAANFTNIWSFDTYVAALRARSIIGDDTPVGTYYFDHRQKPISTVQYGNMQLNMTPSSVLSASASVLVGFEYKALINQITGAGSLPQS